MSLTFKFSINDTYFTCDSTTFKFVGDTTYFNYSKNEEIINITRNEKTPGISIDSISFSFKIVIKHIDGTEYPASEDINFKVSVTPGECN